MLDPELFPARARTGHGPRHDHLGRRPPRASRPDLFDGRLPAGLPGPGAADRGRRRRGHEVWEFDGQRHSQVGMNAVVGRRPETVAVEPFRFDQMRPGCFDIEARDQRHGPQRRLGLVELPVDDHRLLRAGVLAGAPMPELGLGRHPARSTTGSVRRQWWQPAPGPDHPARASRGWPTRPSGRRRSGAARRGFRAVTPARSART